MDIIVPMSDLCGLIWCAMAGLFGSRAALQAEILVLRHQLRVSTNRTIKDLDTLSAPKARFEYKSEFSRLSMVAGVLLALALPAHAGTCTGTLTTSRSDWVLTGPDEDICVIAPGSAAAVLQHCTMGHACTVEGTVRPCVGSACVEIRRVRGAVRRP
jgi:hypothetical protein